MQFITNGPDIPDALLQAHEDGRVVFFCGAGISYPARLPGFAGLVDTLYSTLGITPNAVQRAAIKAQQFDTAISLLEADIVGGRERVRRTLATILTPDLTAKNAMEIHEALLTLSKHGDGHTRLITTNFDRLFEEVITAKSLSIERFQAPLLPVPKNRWDGLVYLHGLLTTAPKSSELDRLVVSSGDFGLAYLTERWASRFVSELFRNYSVCFIGYSINDPVLRYMMDALAADRLLGEDPPEMFAFGSYPKGKEEKCANDWRAKNVTPILYREHNRHAYLRLTLQAWAEICRDGIDGKEAIVVKHALTRPQDSSRQDDFVGRMLWALSDKTGLPAKRFAEFNPAPSLEWLLETFSRESFTHRDLPRFEVTPHKKVSTELRFSLIRRPAPYDLAPPMLLASSGDTISEWDDVMFHLARWLMRHLDDPRLVIWIAERGGQLHDRWSWLIERELNRFATLEREGKTSELNEIRLHSPKAVPGPLMRTLWRLLLSSRVKSHGHNPDLYLWKESLKREGLTTSLRLKLRELLTPKVTLKKPFRLGIDDSSGSEMPTRIKQLVDWELELASDHVNSVLQDFTEDPWSSTLPLLLGDFQQLLCDALDLFRELGEADDRNDQSHWDLPSITPHWQNRGFRDWVILIELLRDAWLAIRNKDRTCAVRIAQGWFELPYPTFKRLALFAASQDDSISPEIWVKWLLSDNAWWLWSTDTGREVFRLFVLQGQYLAGAAQEHLEVAIMAGPPRETLRGQAEPDWWPQHILSSTWLSLAKLKISGLTLGKPAAARLAEISKAYPQWLLASNERDEFSHWMSGTGDPDYEDSRDINIAPRKRQELVQWLNTLPSERRPFYEDNWRDVCRTRFFHCVSALCDLAQNGVWPAAQWSEALQAWAEEGLLLRSWRYAAPLVQSMPDSVLQEIDHSVAWWIKAASKSINCHEDVLLNLCRRILALPLAAGSGSHIIRNGVQTYDSVRSAINHPIGHITQALINLWFKQNPNDSDLLPSDLSPIFTALCDARVDRFRHGRVLLGSRLITFFRVDRHWTEKHLLPLFSWSSPIEAIAVWEGFLWSPRLYQPLFLAFKSEFLDTANHYSDLGEHGQQFAALLTYAALDTSEGYTVDDYRLALSKLPPNGLAASAQAFYQAVASAGEQRENYWRNRAQPFWQKIWPKSREKATPRIGEFLTLMAISARDEFPSALTTIKDWIKPIDHPYAIVQSLQNSELCAKFPDNALMLLDLVIYDQKWGSEGVDKCLNEILQTKPELAMDSRYLRLSEYVRRSGNLL